MPDRAAPIRPALMSMVWWSTQKECDCITVCTTRIIGSPFVLTLTIGFSVLPAFFALADEHAPGCARVVAVSRGCAAPKPVLIASPECHCQFASISVAGLIAHLGGVDRIQTAAGVPRLTSGGGFPRRGAVRFRDVGGLPRRPSLTGVHATVMYLSRRSGHWAGVLGVNNSPWWGWRGSQTSLRLRPGHRTRAECAFVPPSIPQGKAVVCHAEFLGGGH